MLIYLGNLKPSLSLTLTDGDGDPLPLNEALTVEVVGRRNGEVVVNHDLNDGVSVDAQGQLVMEWSTGDTDTIGIISLEVVIGWSDGDQTVPLDEVVEVRPAAKPGLVSLDDLIDHMSGISLTPVQSDSVDRILAGSIRGLERKLYRRFTPKVHTFTTVGGTDGWAPLVETPVISVSAIGDEEYDDDNPCPYVIAPNGIWLGCGVSGTVTYKGGYELDYDELADVRLAIMEKVAGVVTVRHDDTLSVKELETRDDIETARRVAATWSDDDIKPFERLRRRVVV